jgi:hypothetical protein
MHKPYLNLSFVKEIEFYESMGEVPNFGDGDQVEFLHPVFEFIKLKTEKDANLSLKISSARIIYSLDDVMGCEWHLDSENEFDSETDYSLLIYCSDMDEANGGLLEFKDEKICPYRGLGILINNSLPHSVHRATPMKTQFPRKLYKLTFTSLT